MSIMIDLPPAIEQEAKGYVALDGMPMEQIILVCMENEFARRREWRHTRSPKAMAALAEWKRLVDQSRGRLTQLVLAGDLGLCTQAASSKVVVTLQEVIRLLQGLVAALERRVEK